MSDLPFWQRALKYAADTWGFWAIVLLLILLGFAAWWFGIDVAAIVATWLWG